MYIPSPDFLSQGSVAPSLLLTALEAEKEEMFSVLGMPLMVIIWFVFSHKPTNHRAEAYDTLANYRGCVNGKIEAVCAGKVFEGRIARTIRKVWTSGWDKGNSGPRDTRLVIL